MKMKLNLFKPTQKTVTPEIVLSEFKKLPEFIELEKFKENTKWMQNGSTMEQQNEISDKIDECIKKINKNPILKTINLAEVNIFPLTVISGEEDSCNYIVDVLNGNINSFNIIDDNGVYTLELNLDKRFNNYETTVFIPVTEEIKVKFDELLTKKSKLSLKNVLTPLYVELFEGRSVMDQLIITNDNFDYFFEIV